MATLLPSLSSDEEKDLRDEETSDDEDNDEINNDFVFGGVLVRNNKELMGFFMPSRCIFDPLTYSSLFFRRFVFISASDVCRVKMAE